MKCVILAAILLCSLVAMVLSSTDAIYEPEYEGHMDETRSVRTKRSPHGIDPASLAFLGGVAAGGIFGPLLYNRLYGNQGGWSSPVVYQSSGWEAPSRGW